MSILRTITGWFRYGGNALGESEGPQNTDPSTSLVDDTPSIGNDGALQISAVWAAVSLLAKTIATLPLMVYSNENGNRELARDSRLWRLLHESPNDRMTPAEFWTTLILNLLLRGNGYARIEWTETGEAYALWPMAADQVEANVQKDGSVVYLYQVGSNVAALAAENVLHIKEMGNGTLGLSRLEYMRATTAELKNSQAAANKLFRNGGKPTGVLMIDKILNEDQRKTLLKRFSELAEENSSRLHLLEANMTYQQVNLTPEDMQLLSTRQYTVQEIGRWFGVPSILINQTEGTTTLGSSSGEIIEAFHKLTIRPMLVNIEQAIRKRVMTPEQREEFTVEYNLDALLRANLKDRMEIYAKAVQNGIKTRNECRQLENDPALPGGDTLTAQVNLAPLEMLGKIKQGTGAQNVPEDAIAS